MQENEEQTSRHFMEQIKLDESAWTSKPEGVPIRKTIIKALSQGNFLFYQDLVNVIISWLQMCLYIYYLENPFWIAD